jgi:hypothetical protein
VDIKQLLQDFLVERAGRHLLQDLRQIVLPLGGGAREQAVANRIGFPSLPTVVGGIVLGLIALGYFRWLAQEGLSNFNLFAILYFGALLLWNWTGPRLLYPVQPQLYLGFLIGIGTVLSWIASLGNREALRELGKAALVVTVLVLISLSVYKSANIEDTRLHVGDLQVRSSWLKSNISSSAIIMSQAPAVDHLYSGRKTIGMPRSLASAGELEDYLLAHSVDYILIAPSLEWQAKYVSMYDDRTTQLIPLMAELVSEGKITLSYSSASSISVYRSLRK